VDPRTGLDDVEKKKIFPLLGLELQPFGHPSRSQSLYRLLSWLIVEGWSWSKRCLMWPYYLFGLILYAMAELANQI
jgi:hypothetical protein